MNEVYNQNENKIYSERKKYADKHGLKMSGSGEIIDPKD